MDLESLDIKDLTTGLRSKIKLYKKRAKEVEGYLLGRPEEWGRFQNEFNREVDAIFAELMLFDKLTETNNENKRIEKLKSFFVNRLRPLMYRGDYIKWSLDKPYGYAGDFKIIHDIYQNYPKTNGFDRLFDNYFQMSAISVAVRNRKNDFKRIINDFLKNYKADELRIMDLACGPCSEIYELYHENDWKSQNVVVDCFDIEKRALEFGRELFGDCVNVNFEYKNALKLANDKELKERRYDIIYSTGLFDYFNHGITVRVLKTLRECLKPGGMIAIATMKEKYNNPSLHFMEWVGDWNLFYRNEENFKKTFIDAGFSEEHLGIQYEQQGIIQYMIAIKD